MDAETAGQWVPVASFEGLYSEVEADLLVAQLRGSGIPVLRVPHFIPMSVLYDGRAGWAFPVRVYVPAEQEQEAREMVSEQEPQSIPQPVRALAQWLLASAVVLMLGAGSLGPRMGAGRLVGVLSFGCALGMLWRGVELMLALRRRRCYPDLRVLAVAVLIFGAASALLYPLVWSSDARLVHDNWVMAMLLVSCALLAAVWMRWRQQREEKAHIAEAEEEEQA